MKKRIISLLLSLLLVVGMIVPSTTIESEAFIGKLIVTGLKVCKSVVAGTIKTAKNVDHYNGNVGKAVLGQFKNIAADLTGADIGEDYGDGDGDITDTEEVITKADLDEIKNQMQTISSELEKTNNAIYQLESTVTEGMRDLSEQLSELNKKLDQLSGEVSDAAQLNRYYTYLNEFFSFFNQYFEAISYYDEQLSYAVGGQRSEAYIKNTFDRFYHLENVEYSGNLDSAVDKLGRYMRGEYVSTESGSLIDVLSTYYILTYKASNKCTDEVAEKAAAAALEDMITYIYYSYCMGIYYREAVMMYQSTYMEEHETDEYLTDFGTYVIQDQLDDDLAALCDDTAKTAGAVMGSLYTNFSGGTLSLDYYLERNDDGTLGYGFTRTVSSTGFTMQRKWAQDNGQCCYLPDAAEGISSYFSDELRDAFMGLTTYKINKDTDALAEHRFKLSEGNRLDTYSVDGAGTLDICVLDRVVASITVTVERIDTTDMHGYGTEEFPYVITSARYFRNLIEGYERSDAHYVLVNDITFTTTINKVADFSGVLDGNGHTVTNLTIKTNSSTYTGGLFAELTGTVKNLTLKNANITVNCEKDSFVYAGAIAGIVKDGGLIYRCNVIDSTVTAQCSYSTTAANPVYNSMETLAGGIAGVIHGGKIDSCIVSETNIEAKPGAYVQGSCAGGLVASAYGGVVSNCAISYYTNTAKIKAGTSAGGFICYMNYGVTLHHGIAVIQYDPLDALNKAPIAEYYNNYWEDSGRKKCTVSGKFMFIDRSGQNLWSGDHFASVAKDVSSNGKYKYDYVHNFNYACGIDIYIRNYFYGTDGMAEFNDYVSGTGMPELKPVTIKIDDDSLKTVYLEGETFDGSGISGYVYDAAGNKMSKLIGYTLKPLRNMSFDSPLTKDGIATDSDGNKYDCYQCQLIYNGTVLKTYNIYVRSAHVYIQDLVPATCTEAGSSVLVCIDCGETKDQRTIPALGHHAVTDPAVSPTCMSDGLTEGSHCDRCGEVIVAQTAVPSTGEHGHTVIKGYDATCTTDGLTDKDYCEGCGLVHTEATVIPATGHNMKSYVVLEPTCTNAGIIQDKCETCGAYGDFATTPALEHSYKDTVVAPTCTQAGYTVHTCEHCGTSHISDVVAGGHDWHAKTVAPTHTEVGYTVYTCSHCGETYRGDYTAPVGHTFGDGKVTKEATCTSEGVMEYSCSCGNSHTVAIAKTEHDMTDTVTAATCTEMGYTTHKCAHCDYSYIDSYTATASHSLKNTVTDATCTDFGYTTHKCEHCDYSYIDNYRSPASHSLKNVVTDPTCTEFGYTTHKCRNCGYSYVDAYTAPVGHTYNESDATCLHKAKCTVCGVECGELNEHNHEAEGNWTKTAKYHTVTYSCCGYAQTQKEEHSYKDGVCEQCGYECVHQGGTATCCEQAVCETCGAHYGELDPNVHTGLDHVSERLATSDAEGNIEYWHCADCDKYYSDRSASTQITQAQSVTQKLPRDYTELVLWLVPIVLNAAVIIMLICVLSKRKKKA